MSRPRLSTAEETDPAALNAFLTRFFGPRKAGFLERHATWWYSARTNQLVIEADEAIAAYCGVIPARCLVGGQVREALWWIDLVVAPEFRGRGLQTLFDQEVRRRSDLLLGFPNELAARIHRKHGWGVREDLRAVMAPLRPGAVNAVRRAAGPRGAALRSAARAMAPAAALWRSRLARYRPREARRIERPDLPRWAEMARRGASGLSTTLRDEAYLRRRYLTAPYLDELVFYESGPIVGVVRRLERRGRTEERVLDLFGELDRHEAVRDLLRTILGDAVRAGSAQVSALAGHAELAALFRRCGFWLGATARFCWSSGDGVLMEVLGKERPLWGLGVIDNDEAV